MEAEEMNLARSSKTLATRLIAAMTEGRSSSSERAMMGTPRALAIRGGESSGSK